MFSVNLLIQNLLIVTKKHLQIQKLYGKPHIEEIVKREVLSYYGKLIITSKLESNFVYQLS